MAGPEQSEDDVMAQFKASSQATAALRAKMKRLARLKARLEVKRGSKASKDKSPAPQRAPPVGYFVLYQIRAYPTLLFQVPPPPTRVDNGGHEDFPPAFVPFPTKRGCGMETKEERSARHKALKEKWGPLELKVKRREANALQRRLRKEAETARLVPLGPQVLFLEPFLLLMS